MNEKTVKLVITVGQLYLLYWAMKEAIHHQCVLIEDLKKDVVNEDQLKFLMERLQEHHDLKDRLVDMLDLYNSGDPRKFWLLYGDKYEETTDGS